MLSSMYRRLLLALSLLAVGCGGSGSTSATEATAAVDDISYVDIVEEEGGGADSLLNVMEVRYNQLCAERKMAYSERDPKLRRELLERNDVACKALEDSLRWVINSNREIQNNR